MTTTGISSKAPPTTTPYSVTVAQTRSKPEFGDDSVEGGEGDDVINGDHGDDTLLGGEGNDTLYNYGGSGIMDGGADDDYIASYDAQAGNGGEDPIFGGSGNDTIYDYRGGNEIEGNDGDDYIDVQGGNSSVDGGADDDIFGDVSYYNGPGANLLTGGSGIDTYVLNATNCGGAFGIVDTVIDFTPGGGGDVIDINQVINDLHSFVASFDDPFAEGFFASTATASATRCYRLTRPDSRATPKATTFRRSLSSRASTQPL